MKNEIKEILDLLKDTTDLSLFAVCGTKEELENMPKYVNKRLAITNEQAKTLLDYITNLQQENYNLKNVMFTGRSYNEVLKSEEDYKQRIDKAIEYIEKYLYEHIIDDLPDEESKFETEDGIPIPNAKEILLNILQNGSDEE